MENDILFAFQEGGIGPSPPPRLCLGYRFIINQYYFNPSQLQSFQSIISCHDYDRSRTIIRLKSQDRLFVFTILLLSYLPKLPDVVRRPNQKPWIIRNLEPSLQIANSMKTYMILNFLIKKHNEIELCNHIFIKKVHFEKNCFKRYIF